jgi:type IV pilus assembly protein PilM
VGIDFGSSSLKVAEVELRDDVLALSTYGELQLGPYGDVGMGEALKLPLPKQIEALVDIMRESAIGAKSGVLSLPISDSFVTVMNLTAKPTDDISTRVPVEARKYIPVPLGDVTLEWSEITKEPEKDEATTLTREVLLAAIQNEALANMKSLLGSIQMVSEPSEIELFSTLRAATKETDTSLAVIDIGAQTSKLYIAEEGFLRAIHRVQGAGMLATQSLAKTLSMTFEEAGNTKRNYSSSMGHAMDIKKTMSGVFDRPFQEFKRVIAQYEAKTGKTIQRVTLTGGSALFFDFAAYAGYVLDKEVTLCNPFAKVAYPAFMEDKLKEIGPIFATALGAALRNFEQ